jgi:hypothetical protein
VGCMPLFFFFFERGCAFNKKKKYIGPDPRKERELHASVELRCIGCVFNVN